MRIILDTDKKTITVPWNYTDQTGDHEPHHQGGYGCRGKDAGFQAVSDRLLELCYG